ncbi:MAG: exodeoxyribonuclease VII large subunit [Bradymonadia bacterium]
MKAYWESDTLVVEFRYHPGTKDLVKSLRGSRFDWASKTWRFARPDGEQALEPLAAHGFAVPGAAAGPVASSPSVSPHDMPTVELTDALGIRALNAQVGMALRTAFPVAVWVAGEVSGFARTKHRRHAYFELVERDGAERAVASVTAVAFENARARIERKLAEAGLSLEDGMTVRMQVRVELYEARGSYQVIVEDVDPAYSMGALALQRERVLAGLREAGLIERNSSLVLPMVPLRVALLTSVQSDAYHDVMSSLKASKYAFLVTPFDVRVQGDALSSTVLAALARVERQSSSFDVVIITRGGGSRVELAAWDDLHVATAVATCPLPVIVAIGHHQDQSVLDFIARSAKTPTEAAELLVGSVRDADTWLSVASEQLARGAHSRVQDENSAAHDRAHSLADRARHAMSLAVFRVERELPERLSRAAPGMLGRESARTERLSRRFGTRRLEELTASQRTVLERAEQGLRRAAPRGLAAASETLGRFDARLTRTPALLAALSRRLDAVSSSLRLADPARVIARGFLLAKDANGAFVTTASAVPNTPFSLVFQDGEVPVRALTHTEQTDE